MARTVTLAKLRGLARLYADQRPGGATAFVPDTDGGAQDVGSVNDLVNLAIAEFYDLLIAARGHEYSRSSAAIAIVAGTSVYSLPADFYQAQSLTLEWGPTDHELVEDYDRASDRAALVNFGTWTAGAAKGYRILATTLEILPTPTTAVTGRLLYLGTCPILTADGQTIDCVNGWEKLPALRVAMELRTIEEMPYGDLERLFERELERVLNMASERQASAPKQVRDIQPEGVGGWPFARRRDP